MAECIFCAIVAQQLPSTVIAENAQALAIMDIHPANDGHVLVLPKSHSTDLFDLPPEIGGDVMRLCLQVAKALKASLQPDGLNLLQASVEQPLDRRCFIRTFICCHGGRGTTRSAGGGCALAMPTASSGWRRRFEQRCETQDETERGTHATQPTLCCIPGAGAVFTEVAGWDVPLHFGFQQQNTVPCVGA